MKRMLFLLIAFIITTAACKKNINTPAPVVKSPVYGKVATYDGKLPAVYINTFGNTIVDDPKVKSEIMVQVGDTIPLKINIGIELRGSSSLWFDQKSFGFEFLDTGGNQIDSTIMDLPSESDFILYAPANDKSLLRNVLIYELSNQIGLYATRTRFVQLYLNGSYNGLYVLMEKIKRNKNRVNISKLSTTTISGSGVTGGYIFKIDKATGDSPNGTYSQDICWRSQYDTAGIPLSALPYGNKHGEETYFLYEYPKAENIVPEQKAYIQKYVGDFETSLASSNYKDPQQGYLPYIDVASFVDFFLLNELSNNPDAYRLSTFINKDKSGKLKMGPIWDYNIAFGNDERPQFTAPNYWAFKYNNYYPYDAWLIPFWWKRLVSDPYFTQQIKTRWTVLRASQFSDENIMGIIDKNVAFLNKYDAINKHFIRWKFLGVKLPFNSFVGQTYQEELDYLKNWIRQRTLWLDQNIPLL
jgi:hypothetical protein